MSPAKSKEVNSEAKITVDELIKKVHGTHVVTMKKSLEDD